VTPKPVAIINAKVLEEFLMNAPKGLYWKQSFFESFNPPKAPETTKSVPKPTGTGMKIRH
jgi:hypothetical protein